MINKLIGQLYLLAFKIVETIAPNLSGKWALHLFFSPFRYKRPPREAEFLKSAKIEKVALKQMFSETNSESYYVTYSWGEGPLVLLVHGWSGRATQMALMMPALVAAGFKVLAIDAFAHGASTGKKSNMVEFKQIVEHVFKTHGPLKAIVGHSVGGVASAYAVSDGVQTEKLVTIGSPAEMDHIIDTFCSHLGAHKKGPQTLRDYVSHLADQDYNYYSFYEIIKRMPKVQGLVIHDREDREVAFAQAQMITEKWQTSRLLATEGLGHRRILRDENVISAIADFVKTEVTEHETVA